MSNLADGLYRAISQEAQNQLSMYQADKTISGEIFSIVNAVTGEYKVRYQDGVWSAFSQGKTKYRVGDNVLVKIPLGDFSKTKYIEGYTYNSDIDTANDASQVEESFSPDWATIYGKDWSGEIGLIAYAGTDHKSAITIFEAGESDSHAVFQQYANRGTQFRVSGEFLTTLVNEQKKGNYGLRLTFVTSGEGSPEVAYTLDSTIFNGSPYQFAYWTPQTVLFTVPKRYFTALKKIEFFQEGFADYDPLDNKTNANLFCRNIQVEWVDVKDLTDTAYYLTIATPQGMVFSNNFPNLTLTAKLMSGAESLMSKSTCSCFWYKEDPSVLVDSDEYEKAAGQGWRRIEKDKFDSITVSIDECPAAEVRYKVVVIYNEENILTKEITLVNINALYDFYLELSDTVLTLKDRNNDTLTASGMWYIELPDASRKRLTEIKSVSVDLKEHFVYPWIKVYCDVYDGTTKLTVVQWTNYQDAGEEDLPNFMLQYVGDDVFHYDANGDVFDVREYDDLEHTLRCNIATSQTDALTFTLKWLDENKDPIGGEPQDLPQSMMQKVWVDGDNVLHFKIRTKFYSMFSHNSVYVRLTALDGSFVDYEKEISFLKDGDQGTNGTTYVCIIRPIDAGGNKVSGNIGFHYKDAWITDETINFKAFVYCNGELITDGVNDFKISYTWNSKNVLLYPTMGVYDKIPVRPLPHGGTDRYSASNKLLRQRDLDVEFTPDELNEFYIKVQVDVRYKTESKISVYAYYPIDIFVGDIDESKVDYTAPSYVMYSASGVNPQYSSDPLKFEYNGIKGTIESTCSMLGVWSTSGNSYLMPASHFTFDNNSIGMLKMSVDENNYVLHSVFMYLNPYGNEALNSWDGTSLELDKEGGSILAPQIGAGEKNNENQFTGVVMGKDSAQSKIGLYGYKDGITTFALKEDGTASFGTKGQITIDGENAQITGKNAGADNGQYMTINLVRLDNDKYAIRIGDKFLVDYDGNVNISGIVIATDGNIGGCNISNGVLQVSEANINGKLTASVIDGSELNVNSANIADSVSADWVYAGNINADNINGGTLDFSKLGTSGSAAIRNLTWNMVQSASKTASIDGIGSMENRLSYLYGTDAGFTGDVTINDLAATSLRLGGWYLGSAGVKDGYSGTWVSWDDIIGKKTTAVFG